MSLRVSIVVACALVACGGRRGRSGGGGDGPLPADASGADSADGADGTAPPPSPPPGPPPGPPPPPPPGSAPRILSLTASVQDVSRLTSLTITAVVADDDGLGDIARGVLESPTGAGYGSFVGGAGDYQISLSWFALHAGEPISHGAGSMPRALVARFVDAAGHEGTRSVSIRVGCEGELGACDGECVDLDTSPEHCGGCFRPVPSGWTCVAGVATSSMTGGCTSAADGAALRAANHGATGNQTISEVARSCSLECLSSPEPCVQTCIVGNSSLSTSCAECVTLSTRCAVTNCLVPCTSTDEAMCTACTCANCETAFRDCAGITMSGC